MNNSFSTPEEILETTIAKGVKKVNTSIYSQLILGFLAGSFIAFAAAGSTMASFNLISSSATYGLGKVLSGCVFSVGLMLVLLAGGELFTGNNLIITSVFDKKVRLSRMLCNWFFVYIGNLAGALFIALLMHYSGLFSSGGGLLGGVTIDLAYKKVSQPFLPLFLMGIMCNWLVCLAVWVSYGAKDAAGKILAIFFVICLFITLGYEHSVANMYYIPAGLLAKTNESWLAMSSVSASNTETLNIVNFLLKNLLPVTLGNIVGGAGLVGGLYYISYNKKFEKDNTVDLEREISDNKCLPIEQEVARQ